MVNTCTVYTITYQNTDGNKSRNTIQQANKIREQEYARNRSNIQTGTCNFSYKLSTVEAVFLPDIGQM